MNGVHWGRVALHLHPDSDVRKAVLADPATAPIPQLHREMFRFTEKFVRDAWSTTPRDLERLRKAGLTDRESVKWATLGSTQSWFTMSADGGGVPLDGDATTGPGVGRTRDDYEATTEGLLGATAETPPAPRVASDDATPWVATNESDPSYREAAD